MLKPVSDSVWLIKMVNNYFTPSVAEPNNIIPVHPLWPSVGGVLVRCWNCVTVVNGAETIFQIDLIGVLLMRMTFITIFFAVCFLSFTPKSKATELDTAATCSAVVLGNASIDFSLGDEASFNEGVSLAITAYLSEVLKVTATDEDIVIADQILATNTDKIINAANTETFDANVYEEVVKCYRKVAGLLLKNRIVIEQNSDKIDLVVTQRIKLLKRILIAG